MKEIVSAGTPRAQKQIVSAKSGIRAEDLVARLRGQPLILPPSGHDKALHRKGSRPGGGCYCMQPYGRASSVGEVIEDHFGLVRWQKTNLIRGLAGRPDLIQAARMAGKAELYELADLAETLGDNDVASRNGTTFHRLTEVLDRGGDIPEGLPPALVAMLERYQEVMADWEVLDTETFVVVDSVKKAGTYDKRMRNRKTGEVVIGDIKTGQNLRYLHNKTCAQVSLYDAGKRYDIGTHHREPIGVSPAHTRGVLIWVPWAEEPHQAHAELRWLDLVHGREVVKAALRVEALRKVKPEQVMLPVR